MSAWVGLYRLLLRSHLTIGRSAALGALGALAVLLTAIARSGDEPVEATTAVLTEYGLGVAVPVTAAWIATSMFGDLVEDRLLVYLWATSAHRWLLATAAIAATLTIMIPLAVVPLIVASMVSGVSALVSATALASGLGVVAYASAFVPMGLRFQRALWWCLGYILVWENSVARLSDGTARLSINSYGRSILSRAADVDLSRGDRSALASVLVPLAVAVVGVAYTVYRLDKMEVD